MKTKKPSVNRAMNSKVLPVLASLGFVKQKQGLYSRVINRVYQHIHYTVETRNKREFTVEYGADFLGAPHEFPTLSFGGQFTRKWYSASSDEKLQESIDEILGYTEGTLISWLISTEKPESYLQKFLIHLEKVGMNPAGHSNFKLACLYSEVDQKEEALSQIKEAYRLYKKSYEEYPVREWAKVHMGYCEQLEDEINKSSANELLDQWYKFSTTNLGIKFVEQEN